MKKIFNTFIFSPQNLVWLILAFSCIDRLDFIGDTIEGQIIIYGLLAEGETTHTVNVGLSRNFGFVQNGIPNANVNLLVKNGGTISYRSVGNGDYELQNFTLIEGQSYSLEVIVGEKVYRSSFQEIPNWVGIDSLSYDVAYEPFRTTADEDVLKIFSKTQLPPNDEPVYLRWIVEETQYWELVWIRAPGIPPPLPPPCFIFDIIEPTKINLFDGSASTTQNFEQLLATRKFDDSFLFPMFISVKQLSINRESYEYWEKIKIVIGNQGSLFDIPPAPIIGNIKNVNEPNETVLGFFEVAKSQVSRFYLTSEISPVFIEPPCTFVLGRPLFEYPSECQTCANRALGRRFVTVRPDWWVYD
ncbi:DUF4249 domain-containing protein [Aquiflexum sp.]|uniref:DUF4249 domain-containing protein n=1 Tax=Aquiflexum sp. TaxID=1872584 RepID=UPI0035938DD1